MSVAFEREKVCDVDPDLLVRWFIAESEAALREQDEAAIFNAAVDFGWAHDLRSHQVTRILERLHRRAGVRRASVTGFERAATPLEKPRCRACRITS